MKNQYNITIHFIDDSTLKLEGVKNFIELSDRLEFDCPELFNHEVKNWNHYVITRDKIIYYYFQDNHEVYTEKGDN